MADTSQSQQPSQASELQTNGLPDGVEDDEKSKMRPADIDADMREMERRKRVEMIMNSRLFREELERIIESQLKDGNGPAGLLQQISDMMGMQGGRLQSGNVFRSASCVVPINDIRGVESMGYAKGEKILRCKLAAVYRLMDLYGWSQGVYNNITARLNQDQEHFLVNPFGMLYHEITASSLVKIDMQGNIVEAGTTNFGVNITGFLLHAAIHAARPDIKCIIHVHTPSVLAVSSLKCGLLPLCQEAVVVGEISQHPYLGGLSEPEEREKIARNLGPLNKVMFLTNHGVVCCGETVEEAFFNVYNTVLACETQIKLMPMGIDNLVLVSDEARKQIYEAARRPPDSATKQPDPADLPPSGIKKEKQWRVGGVEFEALMRMLDNAGFRTGYIYRHPLVKGDPPRPRNDVEVPPAVSSLGYLLEEEEMYKQGHWKKYADGRKTHDRTRWLNSPNVYQKVEILETGTPDPKKITKWVDANAEEWVAEGSPTHSSTPVKIESALQFVPKGTNPKEFKKLQQQIKDNRRSDKITSGPQSHILEGVSWEEAKKLQDANISATGDQVILVGAASKGIIQRGFQHNALVYKTPYAKNPFDTITDEELEEYKKVVERKQRGESFDEEQSESEPLSSSLHNSRPTNEESVSAAKSPLLSPTSAASETEEESRDEPRVLRIETKQVPRPSQAEVVLSDDNNGKVAQDQCGQLHEELKTNAHNHHRLTCCSCNNFVLMHSCPSTCFPPLGTLPQAAKQACLTSYTSLTSLSTNVSGKCQRKRYPDFVVGCRITRFANVPHLQRKEIEEALYSSRNSKLFANTLSEHFLKSRSGNKVGGSSRFLVGKDEHVVNGFCPTYFSSFSKLVPCHQEIQQKQSLSFQKCSLLSSSHGISKSINTSATNEKLDNASVRNVLDWKCEQMRLLKEEIEKNKMNLKKSVSKVVAKVPQINSTQVHIGECGEFEMKGIGSFLDVNGYYKNTNVMTEFYKNNAADTDIEQSNIITADVTLQYSGHPALNEQSGSWKEHEKHLTPLQIVDDSSKLRPFIMHSDKDNVESLAVAKQTDTYRNDVISVSDDEVKKCVVNLHPVIENVNESLSEIVGQTNNFIASGNIDISYMNDVTLDNDKQIFGNGSESHRASVSMDEREMIISLLPQDGQIIENKERLVEVSERSLYLPEENSRRGCSADVVNISVKSNVLGVLDYKTKEEEDEEEQFVDFYYIFDSETVSSNENIAHTNSSVAVDRDQRIIDSAPEEFSEIINKFPVDYLSANECSGCSRNGEKCMCRNVQRKLEGFRNDQNFCEFFEEVTEGSCINGNVYNCISGNDIYLEDTTDIFLQFCRLYEESYGSVNNVGEDTGQVASSSVHREFEDGVNNTSGNFTSIINDNPDKPASLVQDCNNTAEKNCDTNNCYHNATLNYEALTYNQQDLYFKTTGLQGDNSSADKSNVHSAADSQSDGQQILFDELCDLHNGLHPSEENFAMNDNLIGNNMDDHQSREFGKKECARVNEVIAVDNVCALHFSEKNQLDHVQKIKMQTKCTCKDSNSIKNECGKFAVINSNGQEIFHTMFSGVHNTGEKLDNNADQDGIHVAMGEGHKGNRKVSVVELNDVFEHKDDKPGFCLVSGHDDKCHVDGDLHSNCSVPVASKAFIENYSLSKHYDKSRPLNTRYFKEDIFYKNKCTYCKQNVDLEESKQTVLHDTFEESDNSENNDGQYIIKNLNVGDDQQQLGNCFQNSFDIVQKFLLITEEMCSSNCNAFPHLEDSAVDLNMDDMVKSGRCIERNIPPGKQIEAKNEMCINEMKCGCFGIVNITEMVRRGGHYNRHSEIGVQYVVFDEMFTKHLTVSKCKSMKTLLGVCSEYKCRVTNALHEKLIYLLMNNICDNLVDNIRCIELLPTSSFILQKDGQYVPQHKEICLLKQEETVCNFFRLCGSLVTLKQNTSNERNYMTNMENTYVLDYSAVSLCQRQRKYFADTSTVMLRVLPSNHLGSENKKDKYVFKNARFQEEIIFSVKCNDMLQPLATDIYEEFNLTDRICKILEINPFSFLHTIFLVNLPKSYSSVMRKIIPDNGFKINFVNEISSLNEIPWERKKAVVQYYQGIYENILLHMRNKEIYDTVLHEVEMSCSKNVETHTPERETLTSVEQYTENSNVYSNDLVPSHGTVGVKLSPPLLCSQGTYLSYTSSPLSVKSALDFKGTLGQLESYFNKNLYTTPQESECEKECQESNYPITFENETPSIATNFTDTEETLRVSHPKCNGHDSGSSLCSCSSSNCSFSGTVPSDLSLSTSSLDIVTALTEVPSLSAENHSLDYYSFSSPILDMEDPEFSLSDIPESDVAGSLNESRSLNLSSDLSFTTQDLEFSKIFSQPQSVNFQKTEVGLSPYLKICFSSSESVSSSNPQRDGNKIVCNYWGNELSDPSAVDEAPCLTDKTFSHHASQSNSLEEKIAVNLMPDKMCLCSECENKTPQNRSCCQGGSVSSDPECTDFGTYDSSSSSSPELLKDRKRVCVQTEYKLALSFDSLHQKIDIEERNASVSGNISLQIELDCSTEQEDECHLVSIQNCVVGYKPHVKKKKCIHQNIDNVIRDERNICESKSVVPGDVNTDCHHYGKKLQHKNWHNNSCEGALSQLAKREVRSQKNASTRQLIVKSKSCQDVSLCKTMNENLLQEVCECSMDGNMGSPFSDDMSIKERSFANSRIKSHSYQNIFHEEKVDVDVHIKKFRTRRRTIDTFFIDGEHIFAVLTPDQGLSPEKRAPDAPRLPQVLSDYSDNETYSIVPPIDTSSSNFTEYIDSLNFSPLTQPSTCLSDISSLSSLPMDRVPFSDVDSPTVPGQQASANSTSLY